MSKVLFMQNCFVPDENQFNRLKRSLESLRDWAEVNKTTENYYRFVLGGYIHEDYINPIEELVWEITGTLFFRDGGLNLFETNVGKGVACNETIKPHGKDFDYLFLFDNDIVFEIDSGDIVQTLMDQQDEMDLLNPDMRYPVISCNFKEHQVHNEQVLDYGHKTATGVIRCSTGNFGCIGGGCWLIRKPHWDKLGGYCQDAIYGKDDGQFYLDTITLIEGTVRHMVALSFDVYVIHPSDEDMAYNLFKADTNVNRVRKMNYTELTEDSEKFWSER